MEILIFEIKGKTYEVKDLRVGKFIDLWKMRTALSMGTYGQMYRTALESSDQALLAIDIEAFFSVFCPDMINDLKPGSIRDLGVIDYLELRDIYEIHIKPWLDKVEKLMGKKEDE